MIATIILWIILAALDPNKIHPGMVASKEHVVFTLLGIAAFVGIIYVLRKNSLVEKTEEIKGVKWPKRHSLT